MGNSDLLDIEEIKPLPINKYFFENSMLNIKTNEIAGKEVKVDFLNSFLVIFLVATSSIYPM